MTYLQRERRLVVFLCRQKETPEKKRRQMEIKAYLEELMDLKRPCEIQFRSVEGA
jgi:hypothetical protein